MLLVWLVTYIDKFCSDMGCLPNDLPTLLQNSWMPELVGPDDDKSSGFIIWVTRDGISGVAFYVSHPYFSAMQMCLCSVNNCSPSSKRSFLKSLSTFLFNWYLLLPLVLNLGLVSSCFPTLLGFETSSAFNHLNSLLYLSVLLLLQKQLFSPVRGSLEDCDGPRRSERFNDLSLAVWSCTSSTTGLWLWDQRSFSRLWLCTRSCITALDWDFDLIVFAVVVQHRR